MSSRFARSSEIASKALGLLAESLRLGRSQVLENYLRAMGKFHRHSASNILLITAQHPTATRVAGIQQVSTDVLSRLAPR